mmetsp:Transcript_8939/g.25636  ORF Transcript_8939/g.25636 Transcript_8939/m.25636 type:complete len:263 (+) Transcript_8939:183-971(+)
MPRVMYSRNSGEGRTKGECGLTQRAPEAHARPRTSRGHSNSKHTTKVLAASSTTFVKSHSAISFGSPHTPLNAKLCSSGPRGSSSPCPMANRIRNVLSEAVSHLSCTYPLPLEFLNVAPPLSFDGAGLIIILKVPVAFEGISKGGDTTVLSLPFSFLASTVHRTRKTPSASCAHVTVCGCAFSTGAANCWKCGAMPLRCTWLGASSMAAGAAAMPFLPWAWAMGSTRPCDCEGAASIMTAPPGIPVTMPAGIAMPIMGIGAL